jgi:hypothetical protein
MACRVETVNVFPTQPSCCVPHRQARLIAAFKLVVDTAMNVEKRRALLQSRFRSFKAKEHLLHAQ